MLPKGLLIPMSLSDYSLQRTKAKHLGKYLANKVLMWR
jgi:hypothetical protein